MTCPADHSVYEALLMKTIDGVISPDERRLLEAHAAKCESCRVELEDFGELKEITDMMRTRILADAQIEPVRPPAVLQVCFLLLLVGLLLLLSYAAYAFFTDRGIASIVKVGAGVAGLGTLGLLGYAIVVRLRAAGRDPYEEIDQ